MPNRTVLPGGTGSAMGYAMQVGGPVISEVETETRFEPSAIVRRAGVKVSANVVIWVNGLPYGSLEADSRTPWRPTEADIDFLQTYATVVSAAIERSLLTRQVEALAQERQTLLNEMFHRIKNLLTNVLSIARRTIRHSPTLEEFQQAFEGRLGALSRAHDLLLSAPAQPVRLRELLALEFNAKGLQQGQQFSIEGPDLVCEPRTIQALALMVFELATNAVKYGALSRNAPADAGIQVRWRVEAAADGRYLVLTWRETGLVVRPAVVRRGFGSELLERLVPQMLGGTTQFTVHPDGIEWLVRFPLAEDMISAAPLDPQFI